MFSFILYEKVEKELDILFQEFLKPVLNSRVSSSLLHILPRDAWCGGITPSEIYDAPLCAP